MKWEYKTVTYRHTRYDHKNEKLEAWINELGDLGWEIKGVSYNPSHPLFGGGEQTVFYLGRPKE